MSGKPVKKEDDGYAERRRALRFNADPMEYAEVQTKYEGGEFLPDTIALISNESPMSGCCLVFVNVQKIKEGATCKLRVGQLQPLKAVVIWCREVDQGVTKVGFKFLE